MNTDIKYEFLLVPIPIFSFIIFSSLSLYWVQSPYDAWRIYEILILILINLFGILYLKKNKLSYFKKPKIQKFFILSLCLIPISVINSILLATQPERAIADASLYFLLFSCCLILSIWMRINKELTNQLTAILAVIPILTLVFLPISIIDRLNGGEGVWTQSFTNIRMLDDALLPCLFLLWGRTGFLNITHYQDQKRQRIISIFIFIVSTIYILSFLFHGARACLFAIFFGLILTIISSKIREYKFYKLPIISILSAVLLFYCYTLVQFKNIGSPLIRYDTSGRTELWAKSINIWINHPFFGVGGNHFLLEQPYILAAHPHNIILKFLSEWGLGSIFFILFAIIFSILIFKNRNKINFFIFAGIISITVNSLLSGSMLYPASQILSIWLIAYGLSFLKIYKVSDYFLNLKFKNYIWIFLIVISISGLLYVHSVDIVCNQCISVDLEGAPAFWDSGRAIHLSSIDSK